MVASRVIAKRGKKVETVAPLDRKADPHQRFLGGEAFVSKQLIPVFSDDSGGKLAEEPEQPVRGLGEPGRLQRQFDRMRQGGQPSLTEIRMDRELRAEFVPLRPERCKRRAPIGAGRDQLDGQRDAFQRPEEQLQMRVIGEIDLRDPAEQFAVEGGFEPVDRMDEGPSRTADAIAAAERREECQARNGRQGAKGLLGRAALPLWVPGGFQIVQHQQPWTLTDMRQGRPEPALRIGSHSPRDGVLH
jgi:hypothetical protein